MFSLARYATLGQKKSFMMENWKKKTTSKEKTYRKMYSHYLTKSHLPQTHLTSISRDFRCTLLNLRSGGREWVMKLITPTFQKLALSCKDKIFIPTTLMQNHEFVTCEMKYISCSELLPDKAHIARWALKRRLACHPWLWNKKKNYA